MEITFTDTVGVDEQYRPIPASLMLPDWYKDTESYVTKEKLPLGNGLTSGTIKRCMPVFDVLNTGYLILTYCDIWVSKKPNEFGKVEDWYEWSLSNGITFHQERQAPLHPQVIGNGSPIPKWENPWSIQTPKGYSVLITAPFHRKNVLTAFPAVVDSDTYYENINIVFSKSDPDFEGLIPAGTPIAQVVPFQREKWEMKIGSDKELKDKERSRIKLRSKIFDSYKTQFRQDKSYR